MKIVSLISMRLVTPERTTGMVLALAALCTAYDTALPSTRWFSESTINGVTVMTAPLTESGIVSVSSNEMESRNGAPYSTESRVE